MIQRTNRRKIRYFEACRSDTDSGAGIWCPRVGKYVKERGAVEGITKLGCDYPIGRPKYQSIPPALGGLDS
jgi:hypothetical protein